MADIAEITNAEAGSSVRTKLNTIRTYINSLKNLTGLVKVSGEALSAASAGTDYQAPLTKATGSDIDTGTDDAKYVTSKAIEDSSIGKVVAGGREITDASDDLEATDVGTIVDCNKATAQTITIPLATMTTDEVIGILQVGAGQTTIAVADGAKQTIVGAAKTAGTGYMLLIWCKDDTTDAEIYIILGGSE